MSQNRQLTIRGFNRAVERKIRETANRAGLSLNKAAVRLLEQAVTAAQSPNEAAIGNSLDTFFGDWNQNEYKRMMTAARDFEMIDRELWK